jgi:anti-sigma B factor antagonist
VQALTALTCQLKSDTRAAAGRTLVMTTQNAARTRCGIRTDYAFGIRYGPTGLEDRPVGGHDTDMNTFDAAQSDNSGPEEAGYGLASVTVEQLPGAVVIRVAGEIDMLTAPALDDAVRQSLREQPAKLIIDLSAAKFFSSAGISVLVAAHRNSGDDVALRIVARERVILRPLELTGLADDLAIHPTLESALHE